MIPLWLRPTTAAAGPAPHPTIAERRRYFAPSSPPPVQRKPAVDSPDDACEREADEVADLVVRGAGPGAAVRRSPAAGAEAPPEAEAAVRAAGEGGEPLPEAARSFFEPRFGHDFGRVRVHVDGEAAHAARSVHARAYTVERDIVFGAGQYAPGTAEGRRLLAHELTHVVQQGAAGATEAVAGRTGSLRRTSGPRLQRTPEPDDPSAQVLAGSTLPYREATELLECVRITGDRDYCNEEVLGIPPPTPWPSPEELRERLFTMGGPHAWPTALPRSAVRAGGLGMRSGTARRGGGEITRAPELTVPRGTPPPAAPAGIAADEVRVATETIRARLAEVAIPAAGGHLRLYRGGYAYRAATHADASPEAAAHAAYMGEDNPLGLTGRDLRRWRIFQFVMGGEGDTSAINAYDSQIVTVGAGFGATSGRAGAVFNRLPETMRQRLFDHGIQVNADGSLTVLDLERGVVEHGENALRVLQVDERRLGLIIAMAQSAEEVESGGETRPAREWMLRAQFAEATRSIPAEVLDWPLEVARVAIKVIHWQPGHVSWAELIDWAGTGPDVSAMLTGARDEIWIGQGRPASGDFSLEAIERRFRARARQAGNGPITFGPRPP